MMFVVEAVVVFVLLFLLFGPRNLDFGTIGTVQSIDGDHKTLVVYGPDLGGRTGRPDLERLIRESWPNADMLVPTYSHGWASNIDPYDITNVIEGAIRDADDKYHYEKIILFG